MLRQDLQKLSRAELIAEAERAGVPRPRTLTQADLIDEILKRTAQSDRARARGWLGRARDLLATVIEKGLHMPDAARVVRAGPKGWPAPPPPLPTVTLAEIYAAQGHLDRALEVLEEVLWREPDHAEAAALRDKLTAQLQQRGRPPSEKPAPHDAAPSSDDRAAETFRDEPPTDRDSPSESFERTVPQETAPADEENLSEMPLIQADFDAQPAASAPAIEATAIEAAPVIEATAIEAAPVIETTAIEAAPVIEAAAIEAAPVIEAAAIEAAPVIEAAIEAAPVIEAAIEAVPAIEAAAAPVAEPAPAIGAPRHDVDEIVALAIDSETLYVYWEVRPTTFARSLARKAEGALAIRIVAVTPGWDGPIVDIRDERVDALFGDRFLRHVRPRADVRVSIGWLADGNFDPIAVGGEVAAPRSFPSGPALTPQGPPRDLSQGLGPVSSPWGAPSARTLARAVAHDDLQPRAPFRPSPNDRGEAPFGRDASWMPPRRAAELMALGWTPRGVVLPSGEASTVWDPPAGDQSAPLPEADLAAWRIVVGPVRGADIRMLPGGSSEVWGGASEAWGGASDAWGRAI